MTVKPNLANDADEAWIEEQLNAVPGPEGGYSDAQFEADLEKAGPTLEALADKARKATEAGTAPKFPR